MFHLNSWTKPLSLRFPGWGRIPLFISNMNTKVLDLEILFCINNKYVQRTFTFVLCKSSWSLFKVLSRQIRFDLLAFELVGYQTYSGLHAFREKVPSMIFRCAPGAYPGRMNNLASIRFFVYRVWGTDLIILTRTRFESKIDSICCDSVSVDSLLCACRLDVLLGLCAMARSYCLS